jgi:hypothetical protein
MYANSVSFACYNSSIFGCLHFFEKNSVPNVMCLAFPMRKTMWNRHFGVSSVKTEDAESCLLKVFNF